MQIPEEGILSSLFFFFYKIRNSFLHKHDIIIRQLLEWEIIMNIRHKVLEY